MIDVNFDGLRIHGARNYNKLIRILHENIENDRFKEDFRPEDIQNAIDGLREFTGGCLSLMDPKGTYSWIDMELTEYRPESEEEC